MPFPATSLATLLAVLVYFWMSMQVGRTRGAVGIPAPAMTGNDLLERTIRAHMNTLEWMPIFLPALWLFALGWGDKLAALFGVIWVIGRIVYFLGYIRAPSGRAMGFYIQALAGAVLLFGALGRVVWSLVTGA
ncbi:MAPEG family protein [Methylobacterium brachythecii]|uniref:Membrane protein n=1 Tax=Methylobacterium brachythecii TaxID=1176177 RepID=A0A7W6F592_9HYPH|nr:MAPEG family protein [Methylobacterium brachythecii]MBB3900666.1 putative membrane protein YecN with MAPEG domain [Methylobacterium brachythecii]GLS43543.1 membrane protein [Methylobacterium brachythecii]